MYRPGQSGEMDTLGTRGSSTGRDHCPGREVHAVAAQTCRNPSCCHSVWGLSPTPTLSSVFFFFPIDAHSLWYNFTVIHQPRPGQWWCEVQGQVDQKNFLSYDCGSDKVLSVGRLEEQLNATDVWGRQLEMLREAGQRLRLELPGIELEDFTPSGPARLQARMSCECEADGHSKASWEFRCDGEKFLLFDSNSRKWTVVHAGARRMKEKWEEDRVLTNLFRRVSIGDCRIWLREFLMHREKRLEPTASPTVTPGTAQPKSMATSLSPWSLLLILVCVIL
uniref:MHC class I-like antigen recognition-like domain-containing protein n=1 Tax=Callithrix jacchus TaxID=9483 RepID=A0A5F4VSG1_CALJA